MRLIAHLVAFRVGVLGNPAVEPLLHVAASRLWRSRKGYRKACRQLRRAGMTIERGAR